MIENKLMRRILVTAGVVAFLAIGIFVSSFMGAPIAMKGSQNSVQRWKEMERMVEQERKDEKLRPPPDQHQALATTQKRPREHKMGEGG